MLTEQQHQVINDMAGGNWTAATRKTGLPLRTLARWLLDPEFRTEYQRVQREVCGIAETALSRVSDQANALVMVMIDTEEFDVPELLDAAIGILERVELARSNMAELERAHNEFLNAL